MEMHQNAWPQQIALGSFVPVRTENLIPACKNIGATHITNGCYRLHPVEWNIGEAAGLLAGYCIQQQVPPRAVAEQQQLLADLQHLDGSAIHEATHSARRCQ